MDYPDYFLDIRNEIKDGEYGEHFGMAIRKACEAWGTDESEFRSWLASGHTAGDGGNVRDKYAEEDRRCKYCKKRLARARPGCCNKVECVAKFLKENYKGSAK